MKDQLDGQIMTKFVGLRAKKCVIRRKFKFENYKKNIQKQLNLRIK